MFDRTWKSSSMSWTFNAFFRNIRHIYCVKQDPTAHMIEAQKAVVRISDIAFTVDCFCRKDPEVTLPCMMWKKKKCSTANMMPESVSSISICHSMVSLSMT